MTSNSPRLDRAQARRLLAYHHWAGDLLFDAAAALTAQELDAPWGGSFQTGRGLFRHVLGAERIWSDRWQGHSPKKGADYPASHGGAEFRDEWRHVRDEQKRFADGLTQAALDAELAYVNLAGQSLSYPLSDLVTHVVNHGTYHRGQIAQLLRDRGRASPSTDFTLYLQHERSA